MKKIVLFLLVVCCFTNCEKGESSSNGFSKTLGAGGSMARFAIVGDFLYAVDEKNLRVFDISMPASPLLKSTVLIGFEIETIFPFKDRLFIGSTSQVHILNISDPLHPVKLSEAISPTVLRRCDPVVAKDSVAYATLRANGPCGGVQSILSVIDIRDVIHPVEKNAIVLPEPYGLGYAQNALYVCDRVKGLVVFDIQDAWQPKEIVSIKDGNYIDVIPISGSLICWTDNGIILYDISNSLQPVFLAKIM